MTAVAGVSEHLCARCISNDSEEHFRRYPAHLTYSDSTVLLGVAPLHLRRDFCTNDNRSRPSSPRMLRGSFFSFYSELALMTGDDSRRRNHR